ncbi:MAG: hypothetical protein HYX88_02160 [Chloroflexi bacterium]|nr:hypothetical protein [Chloroflexota bacterium]
MALGQVQSTALGMPGLPVVVIRHPIGGIAMPEVHQAADGAVEEVVHVLTTPWETLATEYRGRYFRQ